MEWINTHGWYTIPLLINLIICTGILFSKSFSEIGGVTTKQQLGFLFILTMIPFMNMIISILFAVIIVGNVIEKGFSNKIPFNKIPFGKHLK